MYSKWREYSIFLIQNFSRPTHISLVKCVLCSIIVILSLPESSLREAIDIKLRLWRCLTFVHNHSDIQCKTIALIRQCTAYRPDYTVEQVAGQIGPKPNRPQVKSAPVKSNCNYSAILATLQITSYGLGVYIALLFTCQIHESLIKLYFKQFSIFQLKF